jgi:RNA polymerase sigma-70 factor (TIGR02960 family)
MSPGGARRSTGMTSIPGDIGEREFAHHVNRHKRELHVHCYRMLGSFEEAEDLVQETFLRAWRHRDSFEGGPGFRAWLYRIATNACLDAIRRNGRRAEEVSSFAEIPWLQPYPDRLLDEIAPRDTEPDAVLVARETIELGFLALIQILPPRQRAVLIMRDVLEFSAQETADALETSVASVNSALQRARATLGDRAPGPRSEWSGDAELTEQERELLRGFIETHESGDNEAAVKLMAEDIRITMPPNPMVYDGIESLQPLLARAFEDEDAGEWRLLPTRLNRMPAAASYHRAPGASEFTPFKIDVLRVRDGKIAEVTTFGTEVFPELGLPPVL